jgi:hypothetical protein
VEHAVYVLDHPYVVTVERKSKTVWIAVGDYMGESIRVQDRKEGAALRRWCETAKYRAIKRRRDTYAT